MTIASEISKLSSNLADSYTAVSTKGGTLPDYENFDNLPTAIESIPTGGGTTYPGLDTDYTNGLATIKKGALQDYSVSDTTETGCIAKYGNIYNNFKIFGNPNINFNTGVISNFSYDNYIQLPARLPLTTGRNFDIIFKAKTNSTDGIKPLLSQAGSLRFIAVWGNSYNNTFSFYNSGTMVGGLTPIPVNTWYWFRVTYQNSTNTWSGYILEDNDYILDNLPNLVEWSREWTTTADILSNTDLNLGRNYGQSDQYFKGLVDLSQAVIYVNNVEWWNARGNSAIVKNTLYNNFTVVGSPSIDVNTGIVRDITDTSYINMPKAFPSNVDYADMIFKGKIDSFSSTHSVLFNFNSGDYSFIVRYTTQKFSCYATTWIEGTNVLSLNTWYWFRVKYDGTNWTGYTLEDNNYTLDTLPFITDWRQEWTTTSSIPISGTLCGIGTNAGARAQHWYGVLDLSQSKMDIGINAGGGSLVTINWWKGSKINYSMSYGLLNTSIPSGTPELQINYNPVDRNYALCNENTTISSVVGNKSYVWGNGGLLNFSGYSNYPSYSISPNWGFMGSPTYNTDDMSYSGFSNYNRLMSNYALNISTEQAEKGFTIQLHFKTGSVGSWQMLIGGPAGWGYYTRITIEPNSKVIAFNLCSNGNTIFSITSTTVLTANTEYWVRLVKPDTRYIQTDTMLQFSTDGETWTTDKTATYSQSEALVNSGMYLGAQDSSTIFSGKLYLDGTFIDFNNGDDTTTRVWDMVKETEMTPEPTPPTRVYNNFTTVGSPTVNQSTGVVSGFSSSDYLKLPQVFNPSSNTWEVMFKATTGTVGTSQWLIGSGIWGTDYQGFALGFETDKPCFYLSESGESWDLAGYTEGQTTCSDNTTYYFKLQFTGTEYILSLSTDGTNWNTEATVQSSTPIYISQSPLAIGSNLWNSEENTTYWNGSIDLSESYIKINGSTWWVGYTES